MKLNGIYIIEDDKNNIQWEISSYADLYNKLDLDIFSDLSQKGRDIIVHGLNDDASREYIEGYLKNKQVYESFKQIDLKGIAEMLNSIQRMDISEKTGITPTSLSKLARGMKKMNPDKDKIQLTELRNVRFNTILMLSYYYDKYYRKSNRGTKNGGETVKRIVVGNIYHCQNCGFGVTGSKFCPNCGARIEY
ncbi:hypothetical protein [Lactobacillus taiwanensis]|uniref:hypothetical protein n=1 Tax=Lactobacillus taiwanensis TaxID=508451 RepID=UPI00322061F5